MSNISKEKVELEINDTAPDLTLQTHNEGELNLAWYRGRKNVILAFYPGDWTPVCSSQMAQYNDVISQLEDLETQLFGLSVDSIFSHRAWAKSLGGLAFPLMADFYPHGEAAQKYGVFNPRGYCERVVFLIDKEGLIQYIEKPDISEVPNLKELLTRIENLEKKS